jgi:catalase
MASSMAGGAIGKDVYEEAIDTLNAIFGSHPGYRPVHAKGIMCEGAFRANADARSLTRAPHMQGGEIPVQVRFSDFSGVPVVRDGDPTASPRGMAIRFHLKDGSDTDIVAQSYNGFPARDAEEFLLFLRALASSGPDAPKPTPFDNFLSVHPAAKRFAEAPKPAPQSFATESYYAVDAFRFTNHAERSRFGRYRILPVAGNKHLDAGEAAQRPGNYLFSELAERLAQKPVKFHLVVQVASGDDPIEDPTQQWPEDRQHIELGTLVLTNPLADSEAVQRTISFDPARLPDGIEPGDPLIKVRSAIYAVAARRRLSPGT